MIKRGSFSAKEARAIFRAVLFAPTFSCPSLHTVGGDLWVSAEELVGGAWVRREWTQAGAEAGTNPPVPGKLGV